MDANSRSAVATVEAIQTKGALPPALIMGPDGKRLTATPNRAKATATVHPPMPPLNTRTTGDASVDATVRALGR